MNRGAVKAMDRAFLAILAAVLIWHLISRH